MCKKNWVSNFSFKRNWFQTTQSRLEENHKRITQKHLQSHTSRHTVIYTSLSWETVPQESIPCQFLKKFFPLFSVPIGKLFIDLSISKFLEEYRNQNWTTRLGGWFKTSDRQERTQTSHRWIYSSIAYCNLWRVQEKELRRQRTERVGEEVFRDWEWLGNDLIY